MFRYVALLFCLSSLVFGERPSYSGYKVIRVTPHSEQDVEVLQHVVASSPRDMQLWNDVRGVDHPVDIQVAPQAVDKLLLTAGQTGMTWDTMFDDLQTVLDKQLAERFNMRRSKARENEYQMDVYHPLEEIYGRLDELAEKYDGVTVSSIGTTINARPIQSMYIGAGDKKVIAIDCGIHAREWITPATCMHMITELLTNSGDKDIAELRNRYDWLFIPVLNPDGYSYTWTDDRMWRKNLGSDFGEKSGCGGVDLNRNSDANFGGGGSSPDPCEETYHGPSAFSEKETSAERDLFLPLKGRMVSFYSLHSYSQLWMSPYSYTPEKPKEYDEQMRVAKIGVDALTATHGTRYQYGNTYSIIYQSSGSNRDWAFKNVGPVYTYGLELRDQGQYGFLLPEDQILDTVEETWNGIKAATLAIPVDE